MLTFYIFKAFTKAENIFFALLNLPRECYSRKEKARVRDDKFTNTLQKRYIFVECKNVFYLLVILKSALCV